MPSILYNRLPALMVILSLTGFILPLLLGWGMEHWSREKGLVTLASVLNLAAAGFLCFRLYKDRGGAPVQGLKRLAEERAIWLLMGCGFIFLALDDGVQIHEKIDGAIHGLIGIRSNNWTDRLDDLLILLYALGGLIIMRRYWRELTLFTRPLLWLLPGFFLMGIMVLTDVLTNRDDIVPWAIGPDAAARLTPLLIAAEEISKVAAGWFFLLAFHRANAATETRALPLNPAGAAPLHRPS